jgi:hypothetical protein
MYRGAGKLNLKRYFTNALLMELLRNCSKIEIVKFFGCNMLEKDVLEREWNKPDGTPIVLLGNEFD